MSYELTNSLLILVRIEVLRDIDSTTAMWGSVCLKAACVVSQRYIQTLSSTRSKTSAAVPTEKLRSGHALHVDCQAVGVTPKRMRIWYRPWEICQMLHATSWASTTGVPFTSFHSPALIRDTWLPNDLQFSPYSWIKVLGLDLKRVLMLKNTKLFLRPVLQEHGRSCRQRDIGSLKRNTDFQCKAFELS